MTRSLLIALSLVLASTVFADEPSISPSFGPTSGGTQVTIKGEFGNWPYTVVFDRAPAVSTVKVDENTLVAVTPPHLPGTTQVLVFEYDLFVDLGLTFTFQGGVPADLERVLVPLFIPPVKGAFGSEFRTDFSAYNASATLAQIYGLEPACFFGFCPPPIPTETLPFFVDPKTKVEGVKPNGTPGRFLYVPRSQEHAFTFNLRVHDTSRAALNFGTEIPIVHDDEMTTRPITLTGVPTDARFRNTLRIYGVEEGLVEVTFSNRTQTISRIVALQKAAHNDYEPAYAAISDFPTLAGGATEMIVGVRANTDLQDPPQPMPLWAFISITNNETQAITTITPH